MALLLAVCLAGTAGAMYLFGYQAVEVSQPVLNARKGDTVLVHWNAPLVQHDVVMRAHTMDLREVYGKEGAKYELVPYIFDGGYNVAAAFSPNDLTPQASLGKVEGKMPTWAAFVANHLFVLVFLLTGAVVLLVPYPGRRVND